MLAIVLFAMVSVAAGEEWTKPVANETSNPASGPIAAEEAVSESESGMDDPSTVIDEGPEDANEAPEERAAQPENQPKDVPEEGAAAIEEQPPVQADEEPSKEASATEYAEEAQGTVRWDGVLHVDAAYEMMVRGSMVYRLSLTSDTDLLLEVGGIPVKVTITALQSGLTHCCRSAATESPDRFAISERLSLRHGEYSVTVDPLQEDRQGAVLLSFSSLEALDEAPGTETPAAEPATDPESEQTADEPLSVHVRVSCEEGYHPGARVVLTAVVSDPDYQGSIKWQYSADGGITVCDVEGVEGEEYSFILDETNSAYWWRACLE